MSDDTPVDLAQPGYSRLAPAGSMKQIEEIDFLRS
jgi:hypothetical protein